MAWPRHIYSHEGNIEEVDEEDIFTWSTPHPCLPENSVLASTIPWIDVVSGSDAKRANSIEKLPLFGSDSEEEEGGKVEAIKADVKKAYVAIRRLKLPGLRFAVKTIKQKKKKRVKQPRTKWALSPDTKDEDWIPPMTRRIPKIPAKIRLIKRRPVSNDREDDDLWQQNNFPNHFQQPQRNKRLSLFPGRELESEEERQRREWEGTDVRHQLELMEFYKDLQEIEMKETKRLEEEMSKAKVGVRTLSIDEDEDELGKDLSNEIVSEVRGETGRDSPAAVQSPAASQRRQT